jgi:PhnB protein
MAETGVEKSPLFPDLGINPSTKEIQMHVTPYLSFDGNCEEAFKFYEQAIGAKMTMKMTYDETPMAKDMPKETIGKVVHARLSISDKIIMGSDAMCGRYQKPAGFHISLSPEDPVEAERLFKALSEKGIVTMPMEETFWAKRFGMLVDQFGIPWMINCEKTA